MSEPWVPLPDPDPDSYWNPSPWLCPECGVILQNPRPCEDGQIGRCPRHGDQLGVQRDSKDPENDEEREE